VQADIAGRVAQALNLALEAPMQHELAERPTSSLPAYDAYLKGEGAAQGIWGVNPGELRDAAAYYEQAVALDSTFLLAWAQLSRSLSYVYYIGNGSSADAERARIAAERAVALEPGRPEGRMARGDYLRNVQADNGRALAEYLDGLRVAPNDADLLTGASLSEQSLGRWDESVAQLKRSLEIDPRSATTSRRLGFTYLWMRRYPEALAAVDRAAAIAPDQLQTVSTRAMIYVAQGDLAKAKQAIRQAAAATDPTLLVYFVATYWDLYWLLDDEQQALLLRLTPSAFDNDRATWGEVLAQTYALRGDSAHARIYADSARIAFEEQLRDTPNDSQRHLLLGIALALMGRRDDAVRNGERGVSLNPIDRDAYTGAYSLHQLARIYVMTGRYDQAVGVLERLLGARYFLSAGWLRVDPAFEPLRGNPRFEKLLREGA
jgi:tetratricopeptide (TPR) repeat protein